MGEKVGSSTNDVYLQQLILKQQIAKGQIPTNFNASLLGSSTISPQIDYTLLGRTAPVQEAATVAATQIEAAKPEATEKPKEKKMGFLDGVGHFFKGAAKALGGAICSVVPGASMIAKGLGWKDAPDFSIKNALIAAGTIALCVVCPPAGVAVAAVGVAAGTVKVGKGVYELATADTKEEQEAACEEMGGGTLEVGLSIAGAKAGLKSCGNTTAALAKSEEGASMLTKVKSVGKAFGKDTGESLARNTGNLGKNISTNLKDATSFGEKVKAVKNGVVDTSKESTLYKNIKGDDGLGYIKGTKKTVSDTVSNLKKTGFEKVSKDTIKANKNLEDGLNKLENSGIENLKELKDSPLNTAKELKEFNKKIDSIDKSKLSAEDKAVLKDLKDLAKSAQNKNASLAKTEKHVTKAKEKVATEQKEYDLLKDYEENGFDVPEENIFESGAKLSKAEKALKNAENSKGSIVKGATENVKTWAKTTLDNNAKIAAEKYNKTAGEYKIDLESKDMAADIKTTKESIELANKEIQKAKESLAKATEGTKELKEQALTDAQAKLKLLKAKLGMQEYVFDTSSLANGTATFGQRIGALNGSVTPTIITNISDNKYTAPATEYASTPTSTTAPTAMASTPDIPLTGFVDNPDGTYTLM